MASTLKVNTIAHTGGTSAMTVDSTGRILQPAKPAFSATRTSSLTVNNSPQTIIYNAVHHNQGSHYNSSNGKFTAPVTGLYYFSAATSIVVLADSRFLVLNIQTSDSNFTGQKLTGRSHAYKAAGTSYAQAQCAGVIPLNANDFVLCKVEVETSSALSVSDSACYFTGYLIG